MTHDHMEPEKVETYPRNWKYTVRWISFSICMTTVWFIVCKLIDINVYWNLLPTMICNQIFISNYDRLMSWLNNRIGYFWLIIIASLILSVAFLLQIYVRFWLEVL